MFFSLCFVILTLNNTFCHLSVDSVIVFYINTIIYSLKISFKPEFLSSAEHAILKNVENQTRVRKNAYECDIS